MAKGAQRFLGLSQSFHIDMREKTENLFDMQAFQGQFSSYSYEYNNIQF